MSERGADGPGRRSSFMSRGVADRATASSLAADRRGPRQGDQSAKTKLLAGGCLRILDQGLGPSRAHSSRNRPLEQPGMIAERAQGWARLPRYTRSQLTSTATPTPDVDAPCLVTRWVRGECRLASHRWLLGSTRRPWFLSPLNKALATEPFLFRMVGRFPEATIPWATRKTGLSDG